jgi:hypothetical protein
MSSRIMGISIWNWPRILAKGPPRNLSKKASSELTAWTVSTAPMSCNPSSVDTCYSHGWPVSTSLPSPKTVGPLRGSPNISKRSSETSGPKTPISSVSCIQAPQPWKPISLPLVSAHGRAAWRMGTMGLKGSSWGTFMITGIKYILLNNLGFYWF